MGEREIGSQSVLQQVTDKHYNSKQDLQSTGTMGIDGDMILTTPTPPDHKADRAEGNVLLNQ